MALLHGDSLNRGFENMTTVLVVDDNPMDLHLAGGCIEEENMSVLYAEDGHRALEMIRASSPDIVLTDLNMPECDGLQLVRECKKLDATLPVILMTAVGSESIAVDALNAGASSYVAKRNMRQDLKSALHIVSQAATSRQRRQQVHRFMTRTASQFVIDNDRADAAALVGYLQDTLRVGDICDEGELIRIGTALTEALVNAIDHGNLELDSSLRDRDDHVYYTMAKERRTEEPYRDRSVFVTSNVTKSEAVFTVRDEGPGFDPSTLPDPTDPENLIRSHGRGLMLIRTFMDQVTYNDTGNEITMYKYARSA